MNYVFDAKEKYKERDRRIMGMEQSMDFICRSYNYARGGSVIANFFLAEFLRYHFLPTSPSPP